MIRSKALKFQVLFVFLGILGAGCFGTSAAKRDKSSTGLPFAPEFSLKDANDKTWSNKDFKDSSVFIHFWAAWCAPCIPEIKEIVATAKKTSKDAAGRPVYWVFISEDSSFEKARKILDDRNLPAHLISLLDKDQKVAEKFGTFQYPETYILDREHAVFDKRIGAQDWQGAEGEAILKRALGI